MEHDYGYFPTFSTGTGTGTVHLLEKNMLLFSFFFEKKTLMGKTNIKFVLFALKRMCDVKNNCHSC